MEHILIANEVISEDKIRWVVNLASQVDLMVAVDSAEKNLADLSRAIQAEKAKLGVLQIDIGMGRCGVRSVQEAVVLAKEAYQSRGITFRGVMGYEGERGYKLKLKYKNSNIYKL